MFYAPHILQKQTAPEITYDEYGRFVSKGDSSFSNIGKCRCDVNTTETFITDNGILYKPSYHVVCERQTSVKCGDTIRILSGEEIKAEGKVTNVKTLNYLQYSEIWL